MAWKVNHSAASADLIPEGTYECTIEHVILSATAAGTPYITVQLAVRDDIHQECMGRRVRDSLWPLRTPTEEDLGYDGFSSKRINSWSKAAGLANGTIYRGIDDWGEALEGCAVQISVYHEDYKGKTQAKFWINPPAVPPAEAYPAATAAPQPEIDDDDVPF